MIAEHRAGHGHAEIAVNSLPQVVERGFSGGTPVRPGQEWRAGLIVYSFGLSNRKHVS
jgi:hypothetical protein